jgi:hypothetical protein
LTALYWIVLRALAANVLHPFSNQLSLSGILRYTDIVRSAYSVGKHGSAFTKLGLGRPSSRDESRFLQVDGLERSLIWKIRFEKDLLQARVHFDVVL